MTLCVRRLSRCSDCAASGGVLIQGGDALGLLYGVGKWLHTSAFGGQGVSPSPWRGASAPTFPRTMRAAYVATHFMNFFQAAPAAAVEAYVEDLALWGMNTLLVTIPMQQFSGFDDPAFAELRALLRSIFASAQAAGVAVGLIHVPNQGFSTRPSNISFVKFPDPLGVRGTLGYLTCAHTGASYLQSLSEQMVANFDALDTLLFWPYDEGGCGCGVDWPWGARGFPATSAAILAAARVRFPNLTAILSTWMYDQPEAGEFDGLDAWLRNASGGVRGRGKGGHRAAAESQ